MSQLNDVEIHQGSERGEEPTAGDGLDIEPNGVSSTPMVP